ncbi:MAG TPA: prephenate dehydratase domain-containing protein [Roseivirga sp.]
MINLGLLGPENTFHDLARKRYLPNSKPHYFNSFHDIFHALESGEVEQVLVAISNSMAGKVGNNLEIIKTKGYQVLEKYDLSIQLCLGSQYPNSLNSIKKIYSHPMAIKETTHYFSKYSHIKFIASTSTAGAIDEMKSSKDKQAAVISSKEALESLNLLIIEENIHDESNNITTFGLISI